MVGQNEAKPEAEETIVYRPAYVAVALLAEHRLQTIDIVVVFVQILEIGARILAYDVVYLVLYSHASGYQLQNAQIVRVVSAKLSHNQLCALAKERTARCCHPFEHAVLGSGTGIHKLTYVFCHTASEHIQAQQVVRSVFRIMVVQYLFHYSYAEGTQSYLAILATVKRFVVVVKNLVHHAEYTTAGYKIDMSRIVVAIPYVLYMTGYGRVYLQQVLKLVEHKGEVVVTSVLHQCLKELRERLHTSVYLQPNALGSNSLKFLYKHVLIVFRHIQIEHALLVLRTQQQGCLANTPTAHHHREERLSFAPHPIATQYLKFFLSVVEFHNASV